MRKKFDNFLIGLLWLLTVSLATTFWMNIKYGFNIFSAAHWAYLSELQAYRTQIKLDFYISLIVAIIIGLFGLYMLVRPRKQTLHLESTKLPPSMNAPQSNVVLQAPQSQKNATTDIRDSKPANTTAPVQHFGPTRPMSPSGTRPPIIASQQNRVAPAQIPTPTPKLPGANTPVVPQYTNEIKSIFERNGYIIKQSKHIGKLNRPVLALSYDQTIWIGTSGVSTSDTLDAIQTLMTIFDDTLGDTSQGINIYACIIDATDTSVNSDLIYTFKTPDEMQSFMNSHPNEKPDDYDDELFDAMSIYIDTVTNYIGNQ